MVRRGRDRGWCQRSCVHSGSAANTVPCGLGDSPNRQPQRATIGAPVATSSRAIPVPVTIAIVPSSSDSARVTPEIARAKANAAAGFHATTLDLEERFTRRMLFADNVATLRGYEFVFGKGGVPVVDGGRIIGAVGVSGAVPADNDHAIADTAAGHPTLATSH